MDVDLDEFTALYPIEPLLLPVVPTRTTRRVILPKAIANVGERVDKLLRFTRTADHFTCSRCAQVRSVHVCLGCERKSDQCPCAAFVGEAIRESGYVTCNACFHSSHMATARGDLASLLDDTAMTMGLLLAHDLPSAFCVDERELVGYASRHSSVFLPARIVGGSQDVVLLSDRFDEHRAFVESCRRRKFRHPDCDVCELVRRLRKPSGPQCVPVLSGVVDLGDGVVWTLEGGRMRDRDVARIVDWVVRADFRPACVRRALAALLPHRAGAAWALVWCMVEGAVRLSEMRTWICDVRGTTVRQRLNYMGLARSHLDKLRQRHGHERAFIRWLYLVGVVPDMVARGLLAGTRTTCKKAVRTELRPDAAIVRAFSEEVLELDRALPVHRELTADRRCPRRRDRVETARFAADQPNCYAEVRRVYAQVAQEMRTTYAATDPGHAVVDAWARYLVGKTGPVLSEAQLAYLRARDGPVCPTELMRRVHEGAPPTVVRQLLRHSRQFGALRRYDGACAEPGLRLPCSCGEAACRGCEYAPPMPVDVVPLDLIAPDGGCDSLCPVAGPRDDGTVDADGALTALGRALLCPRHGSMAARAERAVRTRRAVELEVRVWVQSTSVELAVVADHALMAHAYGLRCSVRPPPRARAEGTAAAIPLGLTAPTKAPGKTYVLRHVDDLGTTVVVLGPAGRTMAKVRRDKETKVRSDQVMKVVQDARLVYEYRRHLHATQGHHAAQGRCIRRLYERIRAPKRRRVAGADGAGDAAGADGAGDAAGADGAGDAAYVDRHYEGFARYTTEITTRFETPWTDVADGRGGGGPRNAELVAWMRLGRAARRPALAAYVAAYAYMPLLQRRLRILEAARPLLSGLNALERVAAGDARATVAQFRAEYGTV